MAEPASAQDRADAAARGDSYPPEGDLEIDRQRAGELIAVLLLDCPDVLALLRWLVPAVLTALGPALEEVQAIRRAHGLRPARTGPPALRVVGADAGPGHRRDGIWWQQVDPAGRERRAAAAVAEWLALYPEVAIEIGEPAARRRLIRWRRDAWHAPRALARLWAVVQHELPAARARLPG